MCRKNERDCRFIKLFTVFLTMGFNVTKLAILSSGEEFEVQHEIYQFQAWSLKDAQNPLGIFNFNQISSVCRQSYAFGNNINCSTLLD